MVKLNGKDLSKFSKSHTAGKWYIQNLRPASATLKPVLLTTLGLKYSANQEDTYCDFFLQ